MGTEDAGAGMACMFSARSALSIQVALVIKLFFYSIIVKMRKPKLSLPLPHATNWISFVWW